MIKLLHYRPKQALPPACQSFDTKIKHIIFHNMYITQCLFDFSCLLQEFHSYVLDGFSFMFSWILQCRQWCPQFFMIINFFTLHNIHVCITKQKILQKLEMEIFIINGNTLYIFVLFNYTSTKSTNKFKCRFYPL